VTLAERSLETYAAAPDEPLILVSCDSHCGPTIAQLRDYCPADLLEAYDEFAAAEAKRPFDIWIQLRPKLARLGAEERARIEHELDRNLQTAGHYDMEARRRDMDRDGVVTDVIYHSSQNGQPIPFMHGGSLFFDGQAPDLELIKVGIHLYNQWLADACATAPGRHIGLAHLPAWDIEASVAEARWAGEHGLGGLNLPAPRASIANYDNPAWEPLWSVCEDLSMTLNTHVGGAGGVIEYRGPHATALMGVDQAGWLARRGLPRLIFSGVFERHPRLNFVLTEQSGEWWPATMREYDSAYANWSWQFAEACPKKPSEYCATNVYIGGSYLARFEAEMAIEEGYAANVMWGSDYPHAEGTFQVPESPDDDVVTRLSLRHTFAGIDRGHVKRMVSDNAIRCYGLDVASLLPVARRIGAPTLVELETPPERVPTGLRTMGFRTIGPFN